MSDKNDHDDGLGCVITIIMAIIILMAFTLVSMQDRIRHLEKIHGIESANSGKE